MKKTILISLLFVTAFLFIACGAKIKQAESKGLQKVIFHSGVCYGSCPEIDLQINKDRNFVLRKKMYSGKMQPVEAASGNFGGKLTVEQFAKLEELIDELHPDTLTVETVTCCDLPMKTLIVYQGGKRSYFKTMRPPAQSKKLLDYLNEIALADKLVKVVTEVEIEK